jgi:hypothetical protein
MKIIIEDEQMGKTVRYTFYPKEEEISNAEISPMCESPIRYSLFLKLTNVEYWEMEVMNDENNKRTIY